MTGSDLPSTAGSSRRMITKLHDGATKLRKQTFLALLALALLSPFAPHHCRRARVIDSENSTSNLKCRMSVNVEALKARIAKLSADIDLQKEALRQLERNKIAAQRQLNAIRDPLARLPLEITSEIFLRCLPRQRKPHPRSAPMLLLNVCNVWSDIALSTPALWAAIYLTYSGDDILKIWLSRARNYPLYLTLRRSLDYDTAPILSQLATQLKHLEIHEEELNVTPLTDFGPFLHLQMLTIGAVYDDDDVLNQFSLAQTLQMLRLAPNLVQCTFHQVFTQADYAGEPLVLASLSCLKLGDTTDLIDLGSFDGDDKILRNLSLPALQTLFLPLTYITASDFALFLKRSSPPLQKLVMGTGCDEISSNQLDECLRFVPSLTDLQLFVAEDTSDDFLSALGDVPSHLLPNLRSLRIDQEFLTELSYERVLRVLSARRTQLVYFDLRSTYTATTNEGPSPDVLAGLRQFVEEGMKICIKAGSGDFSF
ncbi:hypothetical protein B0H19DRAFT_1244232 [Mycena capillaripes]|nr:hypothetical protein B0H19DRAFT_1244232 [Mycena capillaripes]